MADTEISDTLAEELDYEHDMEAAETSDLAEAVAEDGVEVEDNKQDAGGVPAAASATAEIGGQDNGHGEQDKLSTEAGGDLDLPTENGGGVTETGGGETKEVGDGEAETSDKAGDSTQSGPDNKQTKPVFEKITMSDTKDVKDDLEPGMEGGEYVCRLCNLVFESEKYFKEHREHGDHYHASKGRLPGNGKYHCLLCWKGFIKLEGLECHLSRSEHEERCKRKGMIRFFRTPEKFALMSDAEKKIYQDRELDRERRERLRRSRKEGGSDRRPVRVNVNHYYELDSVGECDTGGIKFRAYRGPRPGTDSQQKSPREGRSRAERSRSRHSDRRVKEVSQTKEVSVGSLTVENLTCMEKVLEQPNTSLDQPRTSLELELEQDMNMEREGDVEETTAVEGGEGSVDAVEPEPTTDGPETSEAIEEEDENQSERKDEAEEGSGAGAGAEGTDPSETMDTDLTDMDMEEEGTEPGNTEEGTNLDLGQTVQDQTIQEII